MHQYPYSLYRTRNRGKEREIEENSAKRTNALVREEVNVVEGDNTKDQHLQYEPIFSFSFLSFLFFFSFILFWFLLLSSIFLISSSNNLLIHTRREDD